MEPVWQEDARISPRLKNALVADLVMSDLGPNGDRWLFKPLREAWEWTEHLGRQLGMRRTDGPGDIHETLLLIVRELDDLIKTWPPRHDIAFCRQLTHEATKHLSATDLLDTLLAGPPHWGRSKIEANCRVDHLASRLKPLLEKALVADLSLVLDKWVEWNVPKLRDRRNKALQGAEAAAPAKAPEGPRPKRVRYERPTGRDRLDAIRPAFQPPGRT